MPFSGLPIVSHAWIRSLLRRSTADDPTITIYHTAKYVLNEVLRREWVARHIEKTRSGGFFRSNFSDSPEAELHLVRVVSLAEMMINLQHVRGYSECASQLQNPYQIEATHAELEVGKLLFVHRVRFEFNQRTNIRRHDYDLCIWCSDGRRMVADPKCKEETGQPSENTINAADILSVHEVTIRIPDFGVGVNWNLFPTTTVTDPEALLLSAGWFRLGKGR